MGIKWLMKTFQPSDNHSSTTSDRNTKRIIMAMAKDFSTSLSRIPKGEYTMLSMSCSLLILWLRENRVASKFYRVLGCEVVWSVWRRKNGVSWRRKKWWWMKNMSIRFRTISLSCCRRSKMERKELKPSESSWFIWDAKWWQSAGFCREIESSMNRWIILPQIQSSTFPFSLWKLLERCFWNLREISWPLPVNTSSSLLTTWIASNKSVGMCTVDPIKQCPNQRKEEEQNDHQISYLNHSWKLYIHALRFAWGLLGIF